MAAPPYLRIEAVAGNAWGGEAGQATRRALSDSAAIRSISGSLRGEGIDPQACALRHRHQTRRCVRAALSALLAAPGAAMLGRSISGGGASPAARAPFALPSAEACSSSAFTSPPRMKTNPLM